MRENTRQNVKAFGYEPDNLNYVVKKQTREAHRFEMFVKGNVFDTYLCRPYGRSAHNVRLCLC